MSAPLSHSRALGCPHPRHARERRQPLRDRLSARISRTALSPWADRRARPATPWLRDSQAARGSRATEPAAQASEARQTQATQGIYHGTKPTLSAWVRWPAIFGLGVVLVIFGPLAWLFQRLTGGSLAIAEWASAKIDELNP